MIIQINTDNHMTVHEALEEELTRMLRDKLSRFSSQLTRIEIHLSDENGQKGGQDDKRCLMEARLEGMQPIVVTETNETLMKSVTGATTKLRAALDTALGKAKNR